jgi:hypothetical protein
MATDINKIKSLYQFNVKNERQMRFPKQGEKQAGSNSNIQDQVSLSFSAKQLQDSGNRQEDLSTEEKQQVNELKRRDAEVRAHEQAHMAAGGGLVTGAASYQYEVGPDGRRYAVGGEVSIDVSPERTPEATIRKMQQVRRAALAPAQPSGTDRAVAARAAQAETKARAERAEQENEKLESRETEVEDSEIAVPLETPGVENQGQQPDYSFNKNSDNVKGTQVNLFS